MLLIYVNSKTIHMTHNMLKCYQTRFFFPGKTSDLVVKHPVTVTTTLQFFLLFFYV